MAQTEETCDQTQKCPPAKVWDTNSVASHQAFDYYREGICAAFMPLRPERTQKHSRRFRARVQSHELEQSVLNRVSAHVHTVRRDTREIAVSTRDCFYLNLPLAGGCMISQNRASVTLRTGDVGLFDGSEPFMIDHGEEGALGVASLMVPKHLFEDMPFERPLVLSHHPVFGRTLAEAVFSLSQTIDSVSHKDALALHQLVLRLARLSAQDPAAPVDTSSRRTAQFLRIKRVIRQNCANQDFGLQQCGALVGLSVGYIQQIFAAHGVRFTSVLLQERLLLAQRNLTDRSCLHLPVSGIAYLSGFNDVSHFGREFKKHFGQSPGVWRKAHGQAVPEA